MEGEYYKTKESVQEYITLAADASGKELIEKLKKQLNPNAIVLEVGSGPGTDWNILNDSFSVIGSDNSPEFLKHLKTENPFGEFLELDASSLKTAKMFDAIYSNKVLHHLSDQELKDSIKRQSEILNTNGIICHSFWRGVSSEVFNGLYVNYHEKETLKDFFAGYFEIISIENYNEFDEGDSIILIGRKK